MLMIVFGIAEVATAFNHHFFGISTSSARIFTYSAAAIGGLYPTDSPRQIIAIVAGTGIVAAFALHIARKWKSFR